MEKRYRNNHLTDCEISIVREGHAKQYGSTEEAKRLCVEILWGILEDKERLIHPMD